MPKLGKGRLVCDWDACSRPAVTIVSRRSGVGASYAYICSDHRERARSCSTAEFDEAVGNRGHAYHRSRVARG